ncbi:hypothetical protein [Candidatus Mesenet endosymbiont of Agriotes lineatus]|uniref:hypothetical protein n=1 Tax=Candidatus Mesenet endosymbiont of Agriotes lineatus TaxID=3077948 RepID=UPI0030CC9902
MFKELKNNINIMSLKAKVEPLINGQRQYIEEYKKNMQERSKSLMDLKNRIKGSNNFQDLKKSMDEVESVVSTYKVEGLEEDLILQKYVKDITGKANSLLEPKNEAKLKAMGKELHMEYKNKVSQAVEDLLNNTRKTQAQRLAEDYKPQGRTKFERLYNIMNNQIEDLKDQELSNNNIETLGNIGILIEYYDEFTKEETRLEEIEKKQEALVKEREELESEKQMLQNNDRQFDICRKLTVYESINKNYELNRIIWSQKVLFELINKIQSKGNIAENRDLAAECVSSSVFSELFTNIIMPLFNDGNLKIALDIVESSGDSSKENVKKLMSFIKIY